MSKSTGKSVVLFADLIKREQHTGVLLSNGNIICLCCGGVLTPNEYRIIYDNTNFAYIDEVLRRALDQYWG